MGPAQPTPPGMWGRRVPICVAVPSRLPVASPAPPRHLGGLRAGQQPTSASCGAAALPTEPFWEGPGAGSPRRGAVVVVGMGRGGGRGAGGTQRPPVPPLPPRGSATLRAG